jgi:hypothetical protein
MTEVNCIGLRVYRGKLRLAYIRDVVFWRIRLYWRCPDPGAQAGATAAAAKATAINEKYHVTDKVSKGFIGGLNKVSSLSPLCPPFVSLCRYYLFPPASKSSSSSCLLLLLLLLLSLSPPLSTNITDMEIMLMRLHNARCCAARQCPGPQGQTNQGQVSGMAQAHWHAAKRYRCEIRRLEWHGSVGRSWWRSAIHLTASFFLRRCHGIALWSQM